MLNICSCSIKNPKPIHKASMVCSQEISKYTLENRPTNRKTPLRQKFISFEQIFIWFKNILFGSNKFHEHDFLQEFGDVIWLIHSLKALLWLQWSSTKSDPHTCLLLYHEFDEKSLELFVLHFYNQKMNIKSFFKTFTILFLSCFCTI